MIRYQEHDTFPHCCLDTRIIDIFLRTSNLDEDKQYSFSFSLLLLSVSKKTDQVQSSRTPVICQLSGDVFVWRYCVLCLHYALVAQFVSPVPALQQQHDVSSKNYSQIYYFENNRDKSKVSD